MKLRDAKPSGKEERAPSPFFPEAGGPSDAFETVVPASELANAHREQIEEFKKHTLEALLLPGETLISRPGQDKRHKGPPAVAGEYRPLFTDFEFERPGVYKVRVDFGKPAPRAPDEDTLQRMERRGISRKLQLRQYDDWKRAWIPPVGSNPVSIEVVP